MYCNPGRHIFYKQTCPEFLLPEHKYKIRANWQLGSDQAICLNLHQKRYRNRCYHSVTQNSRPHQSILRPWRLCTFSRHHIVQTLIHGRCT